jgi:tetratricopeptide (TPR) repeat protein
MDQDFLAEVDAALKSWRRRAFEELGKNPLSKLKTVQSKLAELIRDKATSDQVAPNVAGKAVAELLEEVIESLCPSGKEDLNQPEWPQYILLKNYYVLALPEQDVQLKLAVAHARLFQIRTDAVAGVADILWEIRESEIPSREKILRDLPPSPRRQYVPRRDNDGKDYVDLVIEKLVGTRAWVVTIGGFPGVGKTTLAYQVAKKCYEFGHFDAITWISAGHYTFHSATGVAPVESPITSLSAVLDAIGKTLEHRQVLATATLADKEQLVRRLLLQMSCLIVIDMVEQLPPKDLSDISSFLQRLPGKSKALLTTRKYPMKGEEPITLSGMTEPEANRFIRLEAEDRGIRNVGLQVARDIFQDGGGIPLAMQFLLGEFATSSLPPHSILRHEAGAETEEEFQQILKDMLEAAYTGLNHDDKDKRVFHTVALFPVPATREAIMDASGLEPADITVGLGHLYQRFMVDRDTADRFQVLPITRAFLDGKLLAGRKFSGGISIQDFVREARRNLARHCIRKCGVPNLRERIDFIRDSRQIVQSMLEWTYANNEVVLFLDLVQASGRSLGTLGYSNDRLLWGQRAVDVSEKEGYPARREWFLVHEIGWTNVRMGKLDEGQRVMEAALITAREKGYERVEALALRNLGRLSAEKGDQQAVDSLRKALAIWERLGDDEWIANTAGALGWALYRAGDRGEARDNLLRALALHHVSGNVDGLVGALSEIALVEAALDHTDRALKYAEEAIYTANALPAPAPPYAYALWRRAMLGDMLKEDWKDVVGWAKEAEAIYDKAGAGLHWAREAKDWLDQYLAAHKGASRDLG